MKKILFILTALLALPLTLRAQSGAAGSLIENSVNCATTTYGTIVGTGNPLTKSVVSPGFSGTLTANTYYWRYTFYDFVGHETEPSPETVVSLAGTGRLTGNIPVSGIPSTAMGMRVYIGTSSGAETLQGATIGPASFIQSIPLVSGTALPTTNTTICKLVANDAMWPTGTGYTVALTDTSGNSLPGYPMQWQLMGPGTTVNVSSGAPYYHGVVMFPTPIMTNPVNRAQQFINGPLTINGNFNVTGSYLLNGQPFTGGGSNLVLSTNFTPNTLQNALDFVNGVGTTASNPSGGNEQINVIYGTTGGTAAAGNDSRFNNAVSCVGCGANNYFTRSTAVGQITADNALAYDATNSIVNVNRWLMTDWIYPVGKAVPFNTVVAAGLLAKNSSNGTFDPVGNTDGPDTPTFVVTLAAPGVAQKGYVATALGSLATCFVDNAATLGDYLAANYVGGDGTSVCHSIGATLPTTCTWVVGQSTSTGTAQALPIVVIAQWYGCGSGSGSGTVTGTGTVNDLPLWSTSTAIGNSSESEAYSTFLSGATNGINTSQVVTTGSLSQGLKYDIPNEGATGTTVYKLAKIVSGAAIKAATTDTALRLYPVAASVTSNNVVYAAGITGNAPLVTRGEAVLTADAGGISANDYVGASTTTAGDVMDLGAGPILINASKCIGQANQGAISGSATGTIDLGNCPVVPGALPFASLPACGATYEGISQGVTDANFGTWGATITGGSSSNHVLAYCDGTNWTVAGK
jgi:hypothetical protein